MNEILIEAVFQASSEPTVGRMCQIDAALAGQPLPITVGSFEVVLEFPEYEGGFSSGYASYSGPCAEEPVALGPRYFTARTRFTLAADLAEHLTEAALKAANEALRLAAARLSDALRVEQPNVGMVGEIPRMLSRTATNTTLGVPVRVPEPLTPGYPIVIGLPALSAEMAMSALRDGVSPTRALLSQARHLTQSTASPQSGMAILLAAVAAETYAKDTLKSLQSVGGAPSLRSLQRTFGTALDLYGPIAKEMIGKSLEEEDPALWLDVGNLFSARNRMAHKLKTPTHVDSRQLTIAAMKAMAWLDSVTC
ncbi:hypothetical protein [Streptomyces sp. ID05-18]|uniref:hypothetical protein n=1 Tax=Streptomyces sp. ID05-18 TaxID=3028662 RepID=UPI0029A38235|nr:hypothetical protein [Streptomyces sp. ID05-18]MDX3490174.1 hypothetical protein [Streptomyces sp. ID05-18]